MVVSTAAVVGDLEGAWSGSRANPAVHRCDPPIARRPGSPRRRIRRLGPRDPGRSPRRGPLADGVRGPRRRPTTRAFPGLAPVVAHGARGRADLRRLLSWSDPRRGMDGRSGPRPGRVAGGAAGRLRVRCSHRRRRPRDRASGRAGIVRPHAPSGQRRLMGSAALYRRLLRQARPYWLHLAGVFGLGLLASPVALLNPVPLKIVVDSVLGGHPLPAFLRPLFPVAAGQSPPPILLLPIALVVAVATIGQAQTLASTLL